MRLTKTNLAEVVSGKINKRTGSLVGNRSPLVLFIACFVLGILALAFVPGGQVFARTPPYDFITELNGLVDCRKSVTSGVGIASVDSFLDGNLLIQLSISYPDGGAGGKAGVGIKYTAPKSGRIKIDADVTVGGFDDVKSYGFHIPIVNDTPFHILDSGVEISATRINPRRDDLSYTRFRYALNLPFPLDLEWSDALKAFGFFPPLAALSYLEIPVNTHMNYETWQPIRDSSGLPPSLEVDVATGEELFICVGVKSKVAGRALLPAIVEGKVQYGRFGPIDTKVQEIRINYVSEQPTPSPSPTPTSSPTPPPASTSTSTQSCVGPWSIGQRVPLKKGAEIRQGSGSTYAIHTVVPEDNWPVDVIGGPRCTSDGIVWWDISRKNLDGGGTGWINRLQATAVSTPTTSSSSSYSGPEPPSYAPSFAGQTVSWNGNNFRSDDGKTWIFQGSDAERAVAANAIKARELAEAEAKAQDAGVYLQKSNLLELFMDLNKNASDYGLGDAEYVIIRGPYKATIYSWYRGIGDIVGIYSGQGTYKLPTTTIGSVRAEIILPPAPDPLPEIPVPAPTPAPTPTPPPPAGQSVNSFTLINADNEQTIAGFDPIAPGAIIDFASLPTRNLNIRANTNPQTVGSVKFGFDGNTNYRTENSPPYALASDSGGNYAAWIPTVGSHTVVATPYTEASAAGTAGASLSLNFSVVDSISSSPAPSPAPAPGGYSGQYFDNQTLSGTPKLTRNDSAINFDWGGGTPDPAIPIDHFSARWTKTVAFTAGTYEFSMTGDDGIRLYIDNVLVIDKWIDQGPTTYKATKTLSSGDHTIKMEYYENGGGAVAKLSYQAVAASTNQTIIPQGATWKYLDNNTRPAGWEAIAFDDNAWKSGLSELGYGDGDEATVVGYGPDAGNKYITTYFRKTFSVINAPGYSNLNLRVKRDDGAVVYLNGTEVFRTNMPAGAISHSTLAASAIDDSIFYSTPVSASLLREGTNAVAVEVHQAGGSSSDTSFDLSLTADVQTISLTPSLAPAPAPSPDCTELLPTPWHLEGINAQEKYQSIASTALQGKANLKITYDLHGLKALGGDASAIIFDQNGWKYISLSNYGQNGLNGAQTVTIPLSAFGLNLSQSVGTLHTRFWYSINFVVDISSIAACS